NAFKLVFENRLKDELQPLIDFFEHMQGQAKSFVWTHPTTSQQYAVRFDRDDYDLTWIDQGDTSPIGTLQLSVIEVNMIDTTLTVNLTLDPNMYLAPNAVPDLPTLPSWQIGASGFSPIGYLGMEEYYDLQDLFAEGISERAVIIQYDTFTEPDRII